MYQENKNPFSNQNFDQLIRPVNQQKVQNILKILELYNIDYRSFGTQNNKSIFRK